MPLTQQEKEELKRKFQIILDRDIYTETYDIDVIDDNNFDYKECDALIKLLSSESLNKDAERYLIDLMLEKANIFPRLMLFTTAKYGIINELFPNLNTIYYRPHELVTLLGCIDSNFEYFIRAMDENDIIILLKILDDGLRQNHNSHSVIITCNQLRKTIAIHRYDQLEKSLTGINIEINKDKEEVRKIINYLGFDEKYDFFLTELDKHFNSTSKDSIEISCYNCSN